jgi:hypothetical protein
MLFDLENSLVLGFYLVIFDVSRVGHEGFIFGKDIVNLKELIIYIAKALLHLD